MPRDNENLHGNVPDKAVAALLFIDVINDLEFIGGEALAEQVLAIADNLAELRRRAKAAGLPVIYVNDNFGKWQSDFSKLLDHCLNDDVRGRQLAELLHPDSDDYFVLKPKHSGFFSTTLETLLAYLQARTLILAGVAGNICVLFTAQDAFMRDYELMVPADCVASNTPEDNQYALLHMRSILKADIRPVGEIDWALFQPHGDTGEA
ncbi:isochorismatase [Kouleothrix aurantiaca]|uniref:Isochorismatase n=1 Tax=Kouleothrix aurantiaca TaxID=186479 RepID=A0A0P9DBQ6_9CHLR|nr:isochorismatase [Kouleothrix aurantiaca]